MGNVHSQKGYSGDRLKMLVFSKEKPLIPDFVEVPCGMEELVDWTKDTNAVLRHAGPPVFSGVRFVAYVRRHHVVGHHNATSQRFAAAEARQVQLPTGNALDLTVFLHMNVRIVAETQVGSSNSIENNECWSHSVCSLTTFCKFAKLVRRYNELVEAQLATEPGSRPATECRICMESTDLTLLPCLHAMCDKCVKHWVQTRKSCPFCRQEYKGSRRDHDWNIENINPKEIESNMGDIAIDLQKLWHQERTFQEVSPDTWVQIRSSDKSTRTSSQRVDDFTLVD